MTTHTDPRSVRPEPRPWYAGGAVTAARDAARPPAEIAAQVPRWGLGGVVATAAGIAQTFGRPGLAAMLGAVSLPVIAQAGTDPDRVRARFDFYAGLDTAALHPTPPVPDPGSVAERRAGLHTFDPVDADVVDVTFPSAYTAARPEARHAYGAFARNDTVRLRHWRHTGGPRPTLICVHGFQIGSLLLNGDYFDLRGAWADGFDCVLIQLPHHGMRARGVEGFGYLGLDLAHVVESVAHSVWDVRATLAWLHTRGVATVGLTGVSLGGLVAALVAAVDDRLAFCVPVAAPVSIVDTYAELPGGTALLELLAGRTGTDLDGLRDVCAGITPVHYRPRLAPSRCRVVAATDDRIVNPWQQQLLADHWGCRLVWAPGTHQIHFDRAARRHLASDAANALAV